MGSSKNTLQPPCDVQSFENVRTVYCDPKDQRLTTTPSSSLQPLTPVTSVNQISSPTTITNNKSITPPRSTSPSSPQKSPASPFSQHVNMTPRRSKTQQGKPGSSNISDVSESKKNSLQLQNDIKVKDSVIAALQLRISRLEDEASMKSQQRHQNNNDTEENAITKRKHPISAVSHVITDKGRSVVQLGTQRGSVLTKSILEEMSDPRMSPAEQIASKFLEIFKSPTDYLPYLQSAAFAYDITMVCNAVSDIFETESRCLFMQSPVYVFGDIHGNLEDLHFFADNIWKLGVDLTAGQFLFLGDYVDRGMSGLECVAYIFGLKLLYPKKIHLLRGNHETRDVNSWVDHYRDKSFLYQCKERFGEDLGEDVWEQCNQAFDRMPLTAVIDHDIFCIHGGIPRPVPGFESEIQAIMALPSVIGIMPAFEHEEEWMKQVASDCIWSDPAPQSKEASLPANGFGDSPRGGGAVMFGSKAIDRFLQNNNLSYIIRAHEAHSEGVSLSKGARVFTVFSTSKDHRQGSRAMAGCILVDFEKLQVINRSPKYLNKYVHRRTSLSLANCTWEEIEERKRLGLVRLSVADEEYHRLKREIELDEVQDKQRIAKINAAANGDYDDLNDLAEEDENSENIDISNVNQSPLRTKRPFF